MPHPPWCSVHSTIDILRQTGEHIKSRAPIGATKATECREGTMATKHQFTHNRADAAEWTPGLRDIFDYRDLGVKAATGGDYVAHVIRANGRHDPDAVQQWHVHHCTFQFVMVLEGWAEFEYEGEGRHRIEKGDVIYQRPGIRHREIACSDDFEVLEIVSPADFKTEIVE
jgi:mannose-6-phosphate isomerase-like protein (cupin superfamily)